MIPEVRDFRFAGTTAAATRLLKMNSVQAHRRQPVDLERGQHGTWLICTTNVQHCEKLHDLSERLRLVVASSHTKTTVVKIVTQPASPRSYHGTRNRRIS